MLSNFMPFLNKKQEIKDPSTRRRHTRRDEGRCVSMVNGRAFPVQDWSVGGFCIVGDERSFAIGQEHEAILKFQMRDKILDVKHTARVVRKSRQRVALEFAPLSKQIRNSFQSVIDDCIAQRFAESQAT